MGKGQFIKSANSDICTNKDKNVFNCEKKQMTIQLNLLTRTELGKNSAAN